MAQAFDERIAVSFTGSTGVGGIKPYRRAYGERLENIAGRDAHNWVAGNFIKYAAADPLKTAADLPVDTNELLALCAPRLVFVSCGNVVAGESNWIDARGSFMAVVLAGPVWRLLGKQDLGLAGDPLAMSIPGVRVMVGGDLAWRQHEGGVDLTPNWPVFFEWATQRMGDGAFGARVP